MSLQAICWVLSPSDFMAHAVVGEHVDDDGTAFVARCGHAMPAAAGIDVVPRGPLCAACAVAVAPDITDRAVLTNRGRDADGIGEWFPEDLGGWGGPP